MVEGAGGRRRPRGANNNHHGDDNTEAIIQKELKKGYYGSGGSSGSALPNQRGSQFKSRGNHNKARRDFFRFRKNPSKIIL